MGAEVHEAERIEQIANDRQDGNSPTPVGGLRQPTGQRRRRPVVESFEVSQHQPQVTHRDHRAGENLFGSALTVGGDVFDLTSNIDPIRGGLSDCLDATFDQVDAIARRLEQPASLIGVQVGERDVQFVRCGG